MTPPMSENLRGLSVVAGKAPSEGHALQIAARSSYLVIPDARPNAAVVNPPVLRRHQVVMVGKVVAPIPVSNPGRRDQDCVLGRPRSVVPRRWVNVLLGGNRLHRATVLMAGAHVDWKVCPFAPLHRHD